MSEPLTVLNLGWGVQSWTLAAMMALDAIPRADYLVHADTTHERAATYAFRDRWESWLGEQGLKVVTVKGTKLDVIENVQTGAVMIPAFTSDGISKGQLRRQCTRYWKIRPVRKFVREELKRRGQAITPHAAESWLGISLDEFQRMRTSDIQYMTNVYPLIDRQITRADCMTWLEKNGLPVPEKSSCTFCPYRSLASWQDARNSNGLDWQESVTIDNAIRDKRPPHDLYVHPGRKPLIEAVRDRGTAEQLMFEEPCDSGVCWT